MPRPFFRRLCEICAERKLELPDALQRVPMALYVAEHRHAPDHCPAGQPEAAAFLLRHLSEGEARKHGVTIRGEAVARGQHHLYLIVDAASEETVRSYLAPFAQAGPVEVQPASHCEEVVQRGSC